MSALGRIRPGAARQHLFVSGIAADGAVDGATDGGGLVLLSPEEPGFWPHFQASAEAQDGAPDPLDRWSVRVIGALAAEVGGEALFPFGGPPWHPFPRWALASGRVWTAPVGLLVHDRAGLFISYRGAIRLAEDLPRQTGVNPCDGCARPCLDACPVDAFGSGAYDVPTCRAHLATGAATSGCLTGCAVRRACPVGADRRRPRQSAFHMEAFLR